MSTAQSMLDVLCLVGLMSCALLVVHLDNLNGAVMALSGAGTFLALLFVILHAPDVAHSEVVVGTIALPVLYLLAISKIRQVVGSSPDVGEVPGQPFSAGRFDSPDDDSAQVSRTGHLQRSDGGVAGEHEVEQQ